MIKNQTFKSSNIYKDSRFLFVLWVIFFCYTICIALIFQKVLLPLLPSLHAGGGLISNDAVYFDSVASALADQIRLHGWSSWQLFPAATAPGNVGILAALYALFGHDPTLIIPVNAALHASGGLLIFLLARALSENASVGIYSGLIAASLFIVFPSALLWYGQNHKDGYMIAGYLLILWTWVGAVQRQYDIRGWLTLALGHLAGVVLVAIVRPYGLTLLLVATLGALAATLASAFLRDRSRSVVQPTVFFLVAVITLATGIKVVATSEFNQMGDPYNSWQSAGEGASEGKWQWRNAEFMPDSIERYIESAARTRAGLADYGLSIGAKSMIDEDVTPQSMGEVVTYLPRAFQIALLAPFPSSWLTNTSATRLVATGEMIIYYLCLPGVLLLLFYNRKPAVLLVVYFSSFFLLVYGFTLANMGTLYRVRYGYLFIVIQLGVLGWLTWLDKTGGLNRLLRLLKPAQDSSDSVESVEAERQPARKGAVGSGFLVMALTFLSFVGFFIRDILMAKTFGLGASLDSFFVALLIPMFVVTVLCVPLGTAFIPFYLDVKERVSQHAAQSLVPRVSFWTTASLLLVCLMLYVASPNLLPLLYAQGSTQDLGQLSNLLELALPILLFSGVVILGNSVLNAHGRAVLTSTAQLVVPALAILALLVFGGDYGVQAVMIGMVVGQIVNLLLVYFYLAPYHVSLLPRLSPDKQISVSPLARQYFPLVISAFFVSAVAPVATLLAMSLPEGSVSALNLGSKVVLFVTGLVGAAISTVMLPYFSAMVAKKHLLTARRELSFFLLIATFFSIPVSVALFIWAEEIISLIFVGGSVDEASTTLVARVMQYAVLQLPFFVCNALLLKFATATKHVVSIVIVAFVGLLVNVGASVFLMQHMGVAGIALGGSISVLVSTVLLVLALVRYWHITWLDAVVMLLNWLLFLTLLVSVHFGSVPSIYVAISAYAVLLVGYFSSFKGTSSNSGQIGLGDQKGSDQG